MAQAGHLADLQLYSTILNYYIENYDINNYSALPKASFSSLPCLLVESKAFPYLVSPSGCYANERSAILGYPVLQSALRNHAYKFGVALNPSIESCVATLIGNPPTTRQEAIEAFGYFTSRLGEISNALGDKLGSANIVPLTSRAEKGVTKMTSPKLVFLGDNSNPYREIFDFVDFGQEANTFLLKVGSKHEPSNLEIAGIVRDSPAKILKTLGEEKYLDLLRRLAENLQALKADRNLWKELKLASFLLAYRECPAEEPKTTKTPEKYDPDDYDDDKVIRLCSICPARNVVIVDDIHEYLMFREHVNAAPQDDALETFYQALGVPLLSSIVTLEHRVGGVRRDQSEAHNLRKLVIERSRLFLSEYRPDNLLHDSKWLEKNLSVQVVESVALSYTLKGYKVAPYRERKTASLNNERNRGYTLNVTHQPDPYEISSWIVRLLLKRPKQRDTLALEMVLGSDLKRLRTKGYNVDRILRQKAYETRMAEEGRRQQQIEEERQAQERRVLEREQQSSQAELPPPPYHAVTTEDSSMVKRPSMPGGFEPDTTPQHSPQSTKAKGKNLMSNIQDWSRQLGFGDGQARPPPNPVSGGHIQEPTPQDVPGNERNIMKNLDNAIQASRSYTSDSVFTPPKSTTIEQAKGSYCDSTPAQNIVYITNTSAGVKVFFNKQLAADKDTILLSHSQGFSRFSSLLLDLAMIFKLHAQYIHIFYDPDNSAIAFNTNGALFFNYHWFEQLHLPNFETSRDKKIEAIAYWWITLCHELAHNLVQEHSAAHSFYAESFAQQYFAKVMEKVLQY